MYTDRKYKSSKIVKLNASKFSEIINLIDADKCAFLHDLGGSIGGFARLHLQCFKLLLHAFNKRTSIVVVTLMCVCVCVCAVFEFVPYKLSDRE